MENNTLPRKKSLSTFMRSLHRDLGFFVIGLTIVYSLSGVLLIYRDTNFLKKETIVDKKLNLGMNATELSIAIRERNMKIITDNDQIIEFENGVYNKITGEAKYTSKELYGIFNKFTTLHKLPNDKPTHWFTALYGIILLFLAISSFWMFKPKTKNFKRGMIYTAIGIVVTLILLFI